MTVLTEIAQPDIDSTLTVFCNSIDDVDSTAWDKFVGTNNVYLTRNYVKALEEGLTHTAFRYIQFFDSDNEFIGLGYCQIIPITPNEINITALSERMGGMLPKSIINSIDLKILICGNAFATGENGFLFSKDISEDQAFNELYKAIDEVHLREKKAGNKIAITLIKEFWPESLNKAACFKENGCCEVNIDVNMILQLDASWQSFEDYLNAMNSKFRTKAKQVFKKSEGLSVVDFDATPSEALVNQVDELYSAIVDRANFSFGRLNAKTLFAMKKALCDDFYFRGYYVDSKLIGFSTATLFDDVFDGNFIGLDYDYNLDYAVYQRMLYDFVDKAIRRKLKFVKIGRTAEEIKSGVGAEPVEMKFYAKHRNKVTNAILRPFIQNLKPSEFNLRRPFKAEYYTD